MQREAHGEAWSARGATTDRAAVQAEAGRESRGAPTRTRHVPAKPSLPGRALLSLLLFAGLVYAVWEAVSLAGVWPTFILPTPLQVAHEFLSELTSGTLLANAGVTLQEALGGFALAAVIAGVAGYAIAHSRLLEVLVAPFIAASQAIPALAIAPIIILLLGTGIESKVVVCALVVVFPLLITTVAGLRGIERDYRDVARVFGASRLQMLLLVELPLAAPVLFSGIKLGLTLSVIGAVVGEFVAATSGLGFLINATTSSYDAAPHYAALIALVMLSIALFGLVTLVERMLLRWRDDT